VNFDTERHALADACHRLAAEGLVIGTAGNLSVRVEDRVVVTPTGGVFSELTAEEMTVVDLDGRVTGDGLAPTSELGLHLGVYHGMDGAGAVVHTHSPMATVLSCVVDEVPPVHYQMLALGGSVKVAPYATFGTDELHTHVLEALQGHTAALMQNHGALTYGGDLRSALDTASLLEWACALYWRAAAIGTPRVLSAEELGDVVAQVTRSGYGTTRRSESAEEDGNGG
jgi:L-fuculose-phosphate aldolase